LRNKAVVPVTKPSEKRQKAKLARGKGQLAMGKLTHNEWTQKFDPLFQIKGMERHKSKNDN